MKRLWGLLVMLLLVSQCKNLFAPLTDDRGLSAQGRLERAKSYLADREYARAEDDVSGALSLDSSLSEAYYLRAQIALWKYQSAISEVRGSVLAIADTTRTDTSAMPFTNLKYARKDSILQANLIALENLEILRSGKAPGTSIVLDSTYAFFHLYLDYVISCEVLGMTTLFDLDTNAVIDSVDSLAGAGLRFMLGDTGFALRVSAGVSAAVAEPAVDRARTYFSLARPYIDSIKPTRFDSTGSADFRRYLDTTAIEFTEDLPRYGSSKRGAQ